MDVEIPPDLKRKLVRNAFFSRCVVLGLQLLVKPFPNHDAGVFVYPRDTSANNRLDDVVQWVFDGLLRWDAHYFMHVTLYGYTHENVLAFFPLLPLTVRTLMDALFPLGYILNEHSVALLLYVVVNVVFFIQAAKVLYKLTVDIFDADFARSTVFLFCLNPASVFFTAPYTESLFNYLSFSAMYYSSKVTVKCNRALLLSVLFVTLSICTRSNGLLNVGFLVYFYLLDYVRNYSVTAKSFIVNGIFLSGAVAVCLTPFVLMQFYFYNQFCTDFPSSLNGVMAQAQAGLNEFVLPGQYAKNKQPWCNYTVIPLPYSYVQDKYWNVGFLRYYDLKQIPNFLLAFPAVYLTINGSIKFLAKYKHYLMHFGVFRSLTKKYAENDNNIDKLFVYVIHAFALTIFSVLFINVQVTTRMICSASPVLYWYSNSFRSKNVIKFYYVAYVVVGTIMFAKFLPWT